MRLRKARLERPRARGGARRADLEEVRLRYEQRLRLMVPAEVKQIEGLDIFSGLPEKARPKIIEKVRKYLHVVSFASGEVILREGDYSDSAFYLMRGAVEVVLDKTGPAPLVRGGAHVPGSEPPGARPGAARVVGRASASSTVILSAFPADVVPGRRTILEAGEVFGEISALSRYPVSATVRAEGDVELLQIRLPGLRMLTTTSKPFKAFLDERYRERTLKDHLQNVELFSKLPAPLIERFRRSAELVSFRPGETIAQEGTAADAFYLVRGGFVKLAVQVGAADLSVTYLRKGDHFGEAALLLDESWPFTFQALDHVELVKLSKEDFGRITADSQVEDQLWRETSELLKVRGSIARNPTAAEHVQMAMETGLIHGESVLLIDLSTCTRCDECVRGCADAHGGQPRFIREGQKYRNWLVPSACYQCTDPVCMMDCPTGAISRQVGTLEVTIHEPTCIGCTNCAKRCPWGNIVMVEGDEKRPDGKPIELASKCDLCLTRSEGPACVQRCPQGSAVRISFKDLDRVTHTLG